MVHKCALKFLKMFTDLLGAFMLFKDLLTYRQLLHINALFLLGICWGFACSFCLSLLSLSNCVLQQDPNSSSPQGMQGKSLSAWAGSALLFACKHLVTRKCGVSSAPALLNFLHPMQWVFLFCCPSCSCFSQGGRIRPSCNLCFIWSSLVAYLTSAALPRFFISWAIQSNIKNIAVAAAATATDNCINGEGGMVLTQKSELGSSYACVTVILVSLITFLSIGFLNDNKKISSICCKN